MTASGSNLAILMASIRPTSLLVISRSPVPAAEDYVAQDPECRLTVLRERPNAAAGSSIAMHDLAIVTDFLEQLDRTDGLELLGMIRNRYASRIYLEIKENPEAGSEWSDTDFFSLGMQRAGVSSSDGRTTRIYTYDLETYNRKRDWNSPKNWANPQNFGKYWW